MKRTNRPQGKVGTIKHLEVRRCYEDREREELEEILEEIMLKMSQV